MVSRNMNQDLPFGNESKSFSLTDKGTYVPCYKNHPPLTLGGDLVIYGGSCHTPIVKDADIYVGLDHSMAYSHLAHPWEEGQAIHYPITDHKAPDDSKSFIKMIDWLAEQIVAGKKVHAGCVGGHGRTGTLLAALVKVMTGEPDAIEFVRKNYCKKVVESEGQVAFLGKHFGITKAEPSKPTVYSYPAKSTKKGSGQTYYQEYAESETSYKISTIKPFKSDGSVWGRGTPWNK